MCYKLDFCDVALSVMSVHIDTYHRQVGRYPESISKEDAARNGWECSSGLPYRYRLVSQKGKPLPVFCDDVSHEGVHIVVYGYLKRVVIPDAEYLHFVNSLESGTFQLEQDWADSTDEIRKKRKHF